MIGFSVEEGDAAWLAERFAAIRQKRNYTLPSDYVQKVRYLNKELTPFPGKFSLRQFPYFKEIVDCFAANSPVRRVFIMKGNQLGATTAVLESVLLYKIGCDPSTILFVLPNDEMARRVMETKIDPMIDSANLRQLIFSQSRKASGSRNTGDTKKRKEFPGGYLDAVSAKSGSNFRNFSYKTILVDEADDMDSEVKGEGSLENLILARADAFPKSSKIYFASTPKIKQTSMIYRLYNSGDARKFYVPCIRCGEMQPLEWRVMDENKNIQIGGVVWKNDANHRPVRESVAYKCPHCGKLMKNYDKVAIMGRGEWRATKESGSPATRSYHLTPLYNPPGMLSWEDIVCEYWAKAWDLKADKVRDLTEYQAFRNLKQGLPFEAKNEHIKYENVLIHKRSYAARHVPNVLAGQLGNSPIRLVLMSVDVQKDCLYVDVKGYSDGGVTWTLDFFKLEGETDWVYGVWDDLRKYIEDAVFLADDGKKYKVVYCFIDSGYNTTTVYEFVKRAPPGCFVCKGADWLANNATFQMFSRKSLDEIGLPAAYIVNTGQLKDKISNSMKRLKWDVGKPQPSWYPNFCEDMPDSYFAMFEAEEKVNEYDRLTNKWKRTVWRHIAGKDNHAFDTYVYNLAALTVLADGVCRSLGYAALDWEKFWEYAGTGAFAME